MLKERRTLLLLDEPETHFNPAWRAKFIKILNDSIEAGKPKNDTNVHLLKDVLLTSHSPFIISDCMPNNVIFFDRHKETELVEAISAQNLGFNTYGTSVETILDELFDYKQSIGDWSYEELEVIDFDKIKSPDDVKSVKKSIRHLGDSIEKDMILAKLNRMFPLDEGNPTENNRPLDSGPSGTGNKSEQDRPEQSRLSQVLKEVKKTYHA